MQAIVAGCALWCLISGCTPSPAARDAGAPAPATAPPDAAAPAAPPAQGMANPASVHCEKNGGRLEIITEPAGEVGVCVFADGSRCREWDFYRGQCSPGSCREQSGKCSP